jgi:hypothetical protein
VVLTASLAGPSSHWPPFKGARREKREIFKAGIETAWKDVEVAFKELAR